MPLYDYGCENCGHEFSKQLKISDMNEPLKDECSECHEKTIVKKVSAPSVAFTFGTRTTRTSDNFNDRLKQIHKGSGRYSTMGSSIR